ncbi:hypothetical protein A2774_06055 [Candidatus Roizmanbacteria bacterium RIFCSPHIGHO2_01_FULL_39_12c]|uniref:Uncharacterized protein n=1 Tax=Candidatus Roizmanbacteria bacterium RIFCSPHIGHO2_01_FULL_39_12c TaxID=1802031 RepID=A0A1F7G9L7_9BACT|nr:MAG: hypothetical protein A2774_06055 [Candidatus Roizmanbacteria bacterium RIFCSPHIGHO2_01_FULL_39_12c]
MKLYDRYGITKRERRKYIKQSLRHSKPPSLPYERYESIGRFPPSTLVEPIGILSLALIEAALIEKLKEIKE